MADKECMLRNCAHCLGRLGCEYPENDRPDIGPVIGGDYIDADEFEEGFDE